MLSKIQERKSEFEGTFVHLYEGGAGFPVIIFHGSGTGASTLSNFRRVLDPLAEHFRVIAADLIGYGKSGMCPAEPYFDMAMWLRQLQHIIALADAPKVGIIGHSLSGALALKAAAVNDAVAGVVTTGTMGVATSRRSGSRGWVLPETKEQLRKQVENTVLDPSHIDDDELERRMAVLDQPGYREYFRRMFEGQQEDFIGATTVTEAELKSIQCPVVLFHGADDRSYAPEATSLRLHSFMPKSDVIILGQCAHSVALEYPEKFLDVTIPFFERCANE